MNSAIKSKSQRRKYQNSQVFQIQTIIKNIERQGSEKKKQTSEHDYSNLA